MLLPFVDWVYLGNKREGKGLFGMEFGFSPEQEKLKRDVQEFFKNEAKLAEESAKETDSGIGWGPATWEILQKLGAKGWLAPSWPKEYGGLDGTYIQRFILSEEIAYYGISPSTVAVGMAGPVILRNGSEAQKKEFLTKSARGEIEFALGYTEPQAGSDLAALQIRAEDKGDHFLMNGQKVFNTACHYAQYHWLAARTDPDANPPHKGVSLFVVDLKSPGITISPLWGMGGFRTNEVFYDNVKVPKENLVGEINHGWTYLGEALSFERTYTVGGIRRSIEHMVEYAKKSNNCDPVVRQALVELTIDLEISYLFGARIAWMLDRDMSTGAEAAMAKLWGGELEYRMTDIGLRSMGLYGQLQQGSKWAPYNGRMVQHHFHSARCTITRGSTEVMRNIIALRGLGLPRK